MRILVVEDNPNLTSEIAQALATVGLVDHVSTLEAGFLWSKTYSYDLAVVSSVLPDGSGLSLCSHWRENKKPLSILMMNKTGLLAHSLQCFQAGCDDCIVFPFSISEFLARSKALCRRAQLPLIERKINFGCITHFPDSSLLLGPSGEQFLPTSANYVLGAFLRRSNHLCTHHYLMQVGWPSDQEPRSNNVTVVIRFLRTALRTVGAQNSILSVYGLGYRMTPPAPLA